MRLVLVTMTSQYKVTMTSFCVQRGEGVKKGRKIAVILKVCPLKPINSLLNSHYLPNKKRESMQIANAQPNLYSALGL